MVAVDDSFARREKILLSSVLYKVTDLGSAVSIKHFFCRLKGIPE